MDLLPAKIVSLLQKEPLKPGEAARKLGISRQALHRHLRLLMEAKQVQRHGTGPHVVYSAVPKSKTDTRVWEDYRQCQEHLLPRYLQEFRGVFERYEQQFLRPKKADVADDALNFDFLLDAAAVYSSNIEGNTLNLNSFLNSRMTPRKYRPKEAQEIEDLVSAYGYARKNDFSEGNVLHTHKILSRQFVAPSRQGVYRREPVGVFSQRGLEYMAVEPHLVAQEMHELLRVVSQLRTGKRPLPERFFWATWLHLMIALIHPFNDGNGRTARLCEKWFLAGVLGERSFVLPSEECYWKNRSRYYASLKLGVNYWETDMHKAFPFFAFLPHALSAKRG